MSTRVCVITGASRGIGLATALRFARGGYDIVAAAREAGTLLETQTQIRALGRVCETVALDIGLAEGARRVIEVAKTRLGRIDVLINNAGHATLTPIESMSIGDFDRTVAVNVEAVFHTTHAVWPVLRAQGGGIIVNVSSMASIDPFPGFSVYGACKSWVNLFTRAVAEEGRPLGIRVYAVAPGAVETRMLRAVAPDFPPAGALLPDEVAAVIENVCDDRMRHATGQTLLVRR